MRGNRRRIEKMPACDVGDQRTERRRGRRRRERLALPLPSRETSGEQADRRAFHVALDPGDLTGKAKPRLGLEPERGVEQLRRVEERVAVKAAQARELRVSEPRDHAKHAHLLRVLKLGLEAHHVPERAERVVLPKLHHGVGPPPRAGITETHGLHGPETQSLAASFRHHLDRKASVEIGS